MWLSLEHKYLFADWQYNKRKSTQCENWLKDKENITDMIFCITFRKQPLSMTLGNHSTITEFLLLGLSTDPHIQALLFALFLEIYLLTLMGNLMMLLVIRADSHLHTPMYYFLSHLSFLDLCFSSVTVPKMLENLLSKRKTISVESCLAQVFFVFITAGTEAYLLSVMAYDRYVAICQPILYWQVVSPADPGYSKERRHRRGSGNNCLIKR